jgi:succinate dehydrogenase flavin-adding protein (antitoxin of CptAB toxin-antitoxin module)|tara:strand:+ start:457 stop:792 length:336 start_codon:yes stop_codon:yes gene_type:complete
VFVSSYYFGGAQNLNVKGKKMIEQIDRIKRLKYRSFYTGTKETDLILGNFAEKYLDTLELEQLDDYEELLKIEDPRLYKWITGMEVAPTTFQTTVLELIKEFNLSEYLNEK